jgi:hypothetical protein
MQILRGRKMKTDRQGILYLLCFAHNPLAHAKHYVGFAESKVEERIKKHGTVDGSKIMMAVRASGKTYVITGFCKGTRRDERKLKNLKGLSKVCPICNPNRKPRVFCPDAKDGVLPKWKPIQLKVVTE